LERINNNAYKIDLIVEYVVSAAFNVSHFSLFDVRLSQHLRTKVSQEKDNDVDLQAQFHKTHDENVQVHKMKNEVQDPIQDLGGSMTRKRLRKILEALQ